VQLQFVLDEVLIAAATPAIAATGQSETDGEDHEEWSQTYAHA